MAAENGSPGAWSAVAHAYAKGRGVRRDRREAFRIVLASALAGDLAGIMNLGRYYRDGVGVTKNTAHGLSLLEEAVNRGFGFAAWDVAWAYKRGHGVHRDLVLTAHWLSIAARAEHCGAAYELAIMYENGEGVERSPRKALAWMKRAAEFADASAYHSLGWYFENGVGCRPDMRAALRWYELGANAGNAASAFNLALHFADRGARFSATARRWLQRATTLDLKWTATRAYKIEKLLA
jgi:TPR repeat protein